ncbi:MAG TPA: CaiB/BaiF CoA-transferase family protein [Acetobacteraceae bacterium]|nr:CaiB/BaiF CoA-transferase family protein [Acetobacteraceae bacterium]
MPNDPDAAPGVAADPRGPLAGLRVVEFAGIGPGPFAAMLLADMGADVFRIVRPGTDDDGEIVHRSRRSIALDLKSAVARDAALALLSRADALIEGFRPGVMERLGLGPDIVLQRNRQLVYGRMTGWGQTGPLAQVAGHDINYIALAGVLGSIGPADGNPAPPLNLVGDYGGGALYLVAGLLAALLQAQRSGSGQVVDCAMCDGAASMMSLFWSLSAQGRWNDRRGGNFLDGGAHFYNTYRCADGRFIAVGAIEPQFYRTLCDLLRIDDPDFARQNDHALWPALQEKLQRIFLQRGRDEWCALLEGTEACVAPVLAMTEAPLHPHLAARGTFIERGGAVQPAPAPRFSRTPSAARPSGRIAVDDALAAWQ